jgi:hypothetical protein
MGDRNQFARDANTNQRLNPLREDDHRQIIINFIDVDKSPVAYNIEYVANQAGWTNDTAGLLQALSDVNSWCGGGASLFEAAAVGNSETPSVVVDAVPANPGNTVAGVKGVSILFEGTGGSLGGVAMNSGQIMTYDASMANTVGSIAYVVPNVADANFPLSPRVVITYLT